ncbi:hypothetical protein JCM10213_000224 [Rhodosporidiobolus nylandii]
MLSAITVAAPLLLASSASALALERRAAPTTPPGAVGFEYPPLRGWAQETTGEFCGGYDLNGRTEYPVSGSDVLLKLQRDAFDIQVSYSSASNPSAFDQFSPLLPTIEQSYSGYKCLQAPDFASLGLSVGDTVTMLVSYMTGPKNSTGYQCADVTLVDAAGYTPSSQYTCANITASTQTRGQGQSASSASSSAIASTGNRSTADDGSLSPAAAGGIGAAAAIAAMALLAAGLVFAGFLKFGRRSRAPSAVMQQEVPAYQRGDAASVASRGSMVKA